MGQSLVSIIIVTYNRKNDLKNCINTVLKQTYRNFEIIIVDDCSTDNTLEFVEDQYGNIANVNIIYVRNDKKLGYSISRNIGVSYANGEYIAFHECDDEWRNDKLEKQMAMLESSLQEVGAVYSCYAKSNMNYEIFPSDSLDMILKSGYIFPSLLLHPLISIYTLVLKREAFLTVGGFDNRLEALEDYEFTIRLAQKFDIIMSEDVFTILHDKKDVAENWLDAQIITQCYIMDLYKDELKYLSIKKKKFELVYQDAKEFGNEKLFCKCILEASKDTEYIQFVQEKWNEIYLSSNPEEIETQNIVGVSSCTGCMACYNVCPVGAIKQGYDEEGFLVPLVDEKKCILCGKCKEICPVCNETKGEPIPDECYAVMGNVETRKNSSSGGVFTILAEQILSEGGYVAGVIWDDSFNAIHILSNKKSDIERMRTSKYVQSNIRTVYKDIKQVLQENKKVLFSGCSCQIVGLKRYLEREYDNLILVEIVCHGVPSPLVLKSSISNWDNIEEIAFRKKELFGWGSGLYVKYRNGTEYIEEKTKSPFMFGFLNNWILRKTCYNCKFKNKRYSDIILGDFWGINQIQQFDDGMGTSFVTLNSPKGAYLFRSIADKFDKFVRVQTQLEVRYNPCITESVNMPKSRQLFFDEWKKSRDTINAIETVKRNLHFDIALVYWWSVNYGNALTNFALYTYLKKMGKRIIVLDNFCKQRPQADFKKFAEEHYPLSSQFFPDYNFEMLNASCDTFVVGSDQNWNFAYASRVDLGGYFQLAFVDDHKKKVSYASSFGRMETAMPAEIGKMLYTRFDAISVREEFGVEICNKEYGVEAQRVLDPVFLLEKEDYVELINQKSMEVGEAYILAYILNATPEKRELCKEIQKRYNGIRIITILDANPLRFETNSKILEYDNIKTGLTIEEWLAYIYNAEFVITDSYHGTCFSIIFEKEFVTIKNRESARFETFTLFDELVNRILDKQVVYDVEKLMQKIDYGSVNKRMMIEKDKAKEFIKENILS